MNDEGEGESSSQQNLILKVCLKYISIITEEQWGKTAIQKKNPAEQKYLFWKLETVNHTWQTSC